MSIHNFNYTYTLDSTSTMPLSDSDNTQIVTNICVSITATDQSDATKTMTDKHYVPLDNVYTIKADGLPADFILLDDLTETELIQWFKDKTPENELDIYYTWQIFGANEVDPLET